MPVPKSASELQILLGMTNYFSKFTPNLATLTAPLRDLTWQDVDYLWQRHHQKAFDELNSVISSPAALAYFDGCKPVTVQMDASMRGAGAVLLQDGRPVAYASKNFMDWESNYSNIERDMLAAFFRSGTFYYYVHGHQVTVESDHKPLDSIAKKNISHTHPRLQQMLLKIQKYNYEIKYIPGKNIPMAGALSCDPIPGEEIEDMDMRLFKFHLLNLMRSENPLRRTLCWLCWNSLSWLDGQRLGGFWNYRNELSVHEGIILKDMRTNSEIDSYWTPGHYQMPAPSAEFCFLAWIKQWYRWTRTPVCNLSA